MLSAYIQRSQSPGLMRFDETVAVLQAAIRPYAEREAHAGAQDPGDTDVALTYKASFMYSHSRE